MKKYFYIFIFCSICCIQSQATNYYSRATGNWGAGATWSNASCGGVTCSCIPGLSSDVVTICSGNTVTVASSVVQTGSITVSGGTLIINSGITINCNSFSMTSGTLTVNGTLNVGSTTTGGFTISGGTFTPGTGTVGLNGTTQTITCSLPFYNLNIAGSGNKTMASNITINNLLTLTSNNLIVGAYTLTCGSSSSGIGISQTSGKLTLATTSSLSFGGSYTNTDISTILSNTWPVTITNFTMTRNLCTLGLGSSHNLTVTGAFTLTAGDFYIGSSLLTLNGVVSGNINGEVRGGPTSDLIIGGSGAASIYFDLTATSAGGTNTIRDFTLNRTSNTFYPLSNLRIGGTLNLAASSNFSVANQSATSQTLYFDGAGTSWTGTGKFVGNSTVNSSGIQILGSGALSTPLYLNTSSASNQTLSTLVIQRTGSPILSLGSNLNIVSSIQFKNGLTGYGSIDTKGFVIDMGANGIIYNENSDERIFCSNCAANSTTSYVNATMTLAASTTYTGVASSPSQKGYRGLGIDIITGGTAPGSTTVRRGFTIRSGNELTASIYRWFDITPTTNTGLGATLTINYWDSEINSLDETLFLHYRDDAPANGWVLKGGTATPGNNYVTLTGINQFSTWTLGEGIMGCTTFGIWTGAVDNNWDNAGNWSCNTLPTELIDVTIPVVSPNPLPVVNSVGTSKCRNITIDASASVTVNSGKDLSVYGDWTNNGAATVGSGTIIFTGGSAQTVNGSTTTTFGNITVNNASGVTLNVNANLAGILTPTLGAFTSNGRLTMLSTASQTALIAGTGSGSVVGNVTIQRYMSSALGYHYYSSPINNLTRDEFLDELGTIISGNPYINDDTANTVTPFPNFFMYDETRDLPYMSIGWIGAGTTLTNMRGYCINFGTSTSPLTTDLTGTVNSGGYSINVTKTVSGHDFFDGWNLVGNPYPSPINWLAGSGWTKTNVSNGVYYFNSNAQYTGTYSSFVNGVGAPGGTTGIIPAMQAFYVKATGAGSLSIDDPVRTTDLNPTFYKVAKSPNPLLRLKGFPALNDSLGDETVIYFDSLASFTFDDNFDAYKLMNNDQAFPNIFTRDSSIYSYSISALPPLSNTDVLIPLGFLTKTSGSFTIEAMEIFNFDPSIQIYLEDNQEGMIQDLTLNPTYTFNLNADDPLYRFFIRFSPSGNTGVMDNYSSYIDTWASGRDIYINFSGSIKQSADISIYNMLGQKVIGNEQIDIGTSHYRVEKPGCYIVNVISGGIVYQKKVVIL